MRLSDHVLQCFEAHLRHDLAQLFGDEEEIIHHMFGLAGELASEDGVLGGNPNRAGVQMAFAHHDATLDHQRRRGKAKLIGTEQGGDGHIATCFHLPIGLHTNAVSEPIHHQRLLRFGQSNLPRASSVLDA